MQSDIRSDIEAGRKPQGYALQTSDVGRDLSSAEGFGPVQALDVGIRVWVRSYGLVMESRQQRDERLARAVG